MLRDVGGFQKALTNYSEIQHMIKRRRVLHIAGAGTLGALAGCLNDCELPSDGDISENEPGDAFPMVTVDPADSELEAAHITANIIRHFDTDGPAQLRITFLNDSNRERQFVFLNSAPFPAYTGFHSDGETGLFIAPDSSAAIDEPNKAGDGCWHVHDVPPIDDIEDTVDLAACEAVTETYDIYHATGDDCLKEGEYQFEVADIGEQGHEWGFSLCLDYE